MTARKAGGTSGRSVTAQRAGAKSSRRSAAGRVGDGWQAHVMPGNQPHSNRMAMPIHQVSQYLEGYVDALEATREARRPTIIYQETKP